MFDPFMAFHGQTNMVWKVSAEALQHGVVTPAPLHLLAFRASDSSETTLRFYNTPLAQTIFRGHCKLEIVSDSGENFDCLSVLF